MPPGRHALSVECLKPWTVAAGHSGGNTPRAERDSRVGCRARPRPLPHNRLGPAAGLNDQDECWLRTSREDRDAPSQVLGMPLGRHALSVECLKPWTVAAKHSVRRTPRTERLCWSSDPQAHGLHVTVHLPTRLPSRGSCPSEALMQTGFP